MNSLLWPVSAARCRRVISSLLSLRYQQPAVAAVSAARCRWCQQPAPSDLSRVCRRRPSVMASQWPWCRRPAPSPLSTYLAGRQPGALSDWCCVSHHSSAATRCSASGGCRGPAAAPRRSARRRRLDRSCWDGSRPSLYRQPEEYPSRGRRVPVRPNLCVQ